MTLATLDVVHVKENGKVNLKQGERGLRSYQLYIREAVYGLWAGEFGVDEFISLMYDTVRLGFTAAWNAGAALAGIAPDELTMEEKNELRGEISIDFGSIVGFADDIFAKDRAHSGKLTQHMKRAEMWVNRWHAVKNHAQQMAARDQKLKWVMHPLKEHCSDCINLDGRVYRASTWRKYGIQPQSHSLACGGWRCGCNWMPTTDRATGGRPPRIGG